MPRSRGGTKMRGLGPLILALPAAMFAAAAAAQPPGDEPPAPHGAPQSSVAGWHEFIEGLQTLPDRLLAKLPAEQRADPQVQQEIGRLALASLAASLLESLR